MMNSSQAYARCTGADDAFHAEYWDKRASLLPGIVIDTIGADGRILEVYLSRKLR